jgi:threonine/homoserine/homoserine lactone efflux protein
MGEAIGQILPFAIVAGLSPVPIIAVILMLTSRRGRVNGPVFLVGWLLGLAVLGAVVLVVAGPGDASEGGEPATWVDVLLLVLGALAILFGLRQWRGRSRGDQDAKAPRWMDAIEDFGPPKATGAGAVLAANPKNAVLAIGAAATIAGTGIPGGEQALAYAVFALIATIGVAAPVVISLAMGDRAAPLLGELRRWMTRHNAAIMAAVFLVIGAKLVGDAISGLSS